MRRLVWFTLGFAAASALGVYLLPYQWLWISCGVGLILCVAMFLLRKRLSTIAAVMLLGFSVAMAWVGGYEYVYLSAARDVDGETVNTKIEIADYSYETDYGIAADGRIYLEGKPFQVRVYLKEAVHLTPGDAVRGLFRLRLTTRESQEGVTYHQGSGIFLLAYGMEELSITETNVIPGKYFASYLRRDVQQLIDKVFPEDTVAFARALLLGDSTRLSYADDTAFKVSGIRHVIAVSGLHVSILFSMAYVLAGKKRFLTAVIGIPLLLLFAAVAGFTPSIVRACVMQILMMVAMCLNREYDPPTALSAAVLILLLVNPMVITSVGFQLSVGCMIGIFLFSSRLHDYLLRGKMGEWSKGKSLRAKMIRWTVSTAAITLSAMVVTTPLCALYFGMVSLVGVLTNILTLWVVSFVFYGIMLSCALGCFSLPMARVVAWVIGWPIRYVQVIAKVLASVPTAAVYTCSVYIVAWLVFCYLLFIVFLLGKKKQPILLCSCILLGLAAAVATGHIEPKLDDYRVTVLDVGQGQCILVQKNDCYYMVDCGGDGGYSAADRAAEILLSQGVTKLDGIILTHYDVDHAGGVDPLLTRIKADMLYLPDVVDENNIRGPLEQEYGEHIVWVRDDMTISKSGLDIHFFASQKPNEGNESCLCILFQVNKCDILITGDRGAAAERELLERADVPELELLVVGHHGSASSTSFELLSKTKPAAAVISVGKNNAYGLPDREVLEKLKLFGTRILRTDKEGTITFRG